ncbi:MAG: indolepyruvate oxidoreductase subunit beta family protein [Alphaproteobacteria bacterium]|nr:indolepyruvate oxidoreductase subunit beta family protein [Alphaproteobacteria bacterium]
MALPERPYTIFICTMGGQGGGGVESMASLGGRLITRWIVEAAHTAGFPVQSTLTPGTAQRTGLSYFYVEIYPIKTSELGGRAPVFRLAPRPGDVDLLIAFELVEAGRALAAGYGTPDRTILIGSTHRFYTIAEKAAATDGRFDSNLILAAAPKETKQSILFDMAAIVRVHGGSISAVSLGAATALAEFPIPGGEVERAIRQSGDDVAANLAAYAAGRNAVSTAADPAAETKPEPPQGAAGIEDLVARIEVTFAQSCRSIVREGTRRCFDYQDAAYAVQYLNRLDPLVLKDRSADGALTRETARYLALWMTYEDIVRVADLKTRPERLRRVRTEARVDGGEIVRITEFFKPGLAEWTAILPAAVARLARRWARALGIERRLSVGLHIRSTAPWGFVLLWTIRHLKRFRRRSLGFAEESTAIERWLAAILLAMQKDPGIAFEIAECGRLIKGYGETRERGYANLERIYRAAITPALGGDLGPLQAVAAIQKLRVAALADPDGDKLAKAEADIRAHAIRSA